MTFSRAEKVNKDRALAPAVRRLESWLRWFRSLVFHPWQDQLVELEKLLHYFVGVSFHLLDCPEEDGFGFVQKDDAVGQFFGQAHVMGHDYAGELELVL